MAGYRPYKPYKTYRPWVVISFTSVAPAERGLGDVVWGDNLALALLSVAGYRPWEVIPFTSVAPAERGLGDEV